MWPEDIADIQSRLVDLPTDHGFSPGSKPFFVSEVIDRNDGAVKVDEYYDFGLVTEFRYSNPFTCLNIEKPLLIDIPRRLPGPPMEVGF